MRVRQHQVDRKSSSWVSGEVQPDEIRRPMHNCVAVLVEKRGPTLCVGLLIDDAIVVRENIVRHMEMGKDHFKAASEGTSEIGLAVFSTTMAVIAVFIPVAFMGGMIGRIFFRQFAATIAISSRASSRAWASCTWTFS